MMLTAQQLRSNWRVTRVALLTLEQGEQLLFRVLTLLLGSFYREDYLANLTI